jgi:hypothetical protein
MQRVRIGITGLAVVFLVVLLAAAIVGFRSDDATSAANNAALAAGNASATAQPKDPLAELGVAPGGSTATEPAPPPSPAAIRTPTH